MLRFISRAGIPVLLILCGLMLMQCRRTKKQEYARHARGYYYKLISFHDDTLHYQPGYVAHLSVQFDTQGDSVFWDSYNNLGDRFYMPVDSSSANLFKQYSSTCAVGDSACLLIKPAEFFAQQFKAAQVPFFSKNDSVVKVRFKVKRLMSPAEFTKLEHNIQQREQEQIRSYYNSETEYKAAKDSLGFYWVSKPAVVAGEAIKPGSLVSLWYRGYYLNGRFLEASPERFEMVYGVPDQVLKGVNYVIGRIKMGQSVKIILPSRLAFGENGSTNGLVPPYTPLLYEIKIVDVRQ